MNGVVNPVVDRIVDQLNIIGAHINRLIKVSIVVNTGTGPFCKGTVSNFYSSCHLTSLIPLERFAHGPWQWVSFVPFWCGSWVQQDPIYGDLRIVLEYLRSTQRWSARMISDKYLAGFLWRWFLLWFFDMVNCGPEMWDETTPTPQRVPTLSR